MTDDGLRAGDLLADRYRLIDRIGAGGMSVIWRAKDETLDRLVAVKILDPELAGDERLRELARREAWAVARLNHPDVASVHDFVRCLDGDGHEIAVIVLQLVVGEPLADRIALGAFGWQEALRVGGRVASVLGVAHRAGVVHRDVTPDNIMLHGQQVTVLDFGIAARIGEPDDDSTGASFGTPAYVAPERLDGAPARAATDIYALGVVLHEMLTGSIPFRVRNWDEVAIDHGEPPALAVPGLPRQVAELVRRCLRREPDARPEATEVALVLQRALAHPAHRGWGSRTVRWSVAAVAGVSSVALFLWWPSGTLDDPQTAAPNGPSLPASGTPAAVQTAVQPAPSGTRSPGASATPGGAAARSPAALLDPGISVGEALDAAMSTIDTAHGRGEMREDVAHDLRQLVGNLVNNSATRPEIDAGASGVKGKIGSRESERSITMSVADELRVEVDQLAAALTRRLG